MATGYKLLGSMGLFVGAIVLSSCATLNEDQCKVADWNVLGQQDGSNGYAQTYVAEHEKACTQFGVFVDRVAWQNGWTQGIRQHCTFDNGISRGQTGRTASQSCPPDLASDYLAGHNAGSAVKRADDKVANAQRRIDASIKALAAAQTPEARATALVEAERARSDLLLAQLEKQNADANLQRILFQRQLSAQQSRPVNQF